MVPSSFRENFSLSMLLELEITHIIAALKAMFFFNFIKFI